MSGFGGTLRVAASAAACVAGVAAGVGTTIASRAAESKGPIAGVSVQRDTIRDANGAPIGVVTSATLPAGGHAKPEPRVATAPAPHATAMEAMATAHRGGRVMNAAIRGTSEAAPATAYHATGPLRIGQLSVPAGATVYWTFDGGHRTSFTIRGATARGARLTLSSRATHGVTRVTAGTYRDVVVHATGPWTMVVAPRLFAPREASRVRPAPRNSARLGSGS